MDVIKNWTNVLNFETNYIKIADGETKQLKFLDDDTASGKNEFKGKEIISFSFNVLNVANQKTGVWSVSAKGLMKQLKEIVMKYGQKNTVIQVSRSGSDRLTTYKIVVVSAGNGSAVSQTPAPVQPAPAQPQVAAASAPAEPAKPAAQGVNINDEIINLIRANKDGCPIGKILDLVKGRLSDKGLDKIIKNLIDEGEIFEPQPGKFMKLD